MSDLIDRQSAIDALGDKPLAWTEGEYELGLQNQWQSDVDALKALPSVQPEIRYYGQFEIKDPILISEQQWIPCSERLPSEDGEYLVTRYAGYLPKKIIIDIAIYCRIRREWQKAYPVIAWMPLPEPYQEGE